MEKDKLFENLTENYKVPEIKSKSQAWDEMHLRMEINPRGRTTSRLGWSFWTSAAAAVLLIFIVLYSRIENDKVSFQEEISAQVGQTKHQILPDSSAITLASNSIATIEYQNNNNERKVKLQGEAFFKVQKGGNFTVEFNGGFLTVLGTEFLVSAYDSNLVQISCAEGLVKVNINNESVLLNCGQGLKLYQGVITGPFAIDQKLAKEQEGGVFFWNKIPLKELMSLIGSKFDYKIDLPESLSDRNFSGRIELNKIEESMLIVSLAMNLDYSIENNQRTIHLNEK